MRSSYTTPLRLILRISACLEGKQCFCIKLRSAAAQIPADPDRLLHQRIYLGAAGAMIYDGGANRYAPIQNCGGGRYDA